MSGSRTYILELPAGTPILTGNHRKNPYARNRRVKELKAVIADLQMVRRIPPLGLADVLVEYESPPRRVKDRHPYHSDAVLDSDAVGPTAKALVDGMVEAGIWKSDQRNRIRRVICELSAVKHPRGLVRITITEVVEGAAQESA